MTGTTGKSARNDSARDRLGARPLYSGTARRQARRGDRAAQSLAPAKRRARIARRNRAQEYPDDRSDRRRQDRDRAPPRAPRASAIHQGRGLALYRGRLRRPRRRIDDPRPGRNRGQDGARGGTRAGRDPGSRRRRRAPARHPLSAARQGPPRGRNRARGRRGAAIRTAIRARSCASCCASGHLDDREVEVEISAQSTPMVEVLAPQGMEEMGANMQASC